MRAMGGAEGVVHVDLTITEQSQFSGKLLLPGFHFSLGGLFLLVRGILGNLDLAFLFLVKAGVFHEQNFARFQRPR